MRLNTRVLGSLRFAGPALLFLLWVIVALMSIGIARQEYQEDATAQTERAARQAGARLIRFVERYAVSDPRIVREELSLMSSDPALVDAAVFDSAGAVIFANDRALLGRHRTELLSERDHGLLVRATSNRLAVVERQQRQQALVYFAGYQPPPDSHEIRGDERGAVYLRYDLSANLREATRHAFLERLPDILMMIAVTGLTLLLTRRQIAQPVARIASSAAAVKAGRFERIERPEGPTEIRDLAHAFNDMTGQIASQMDELAGQTQRMRAVLDNMHDGVLVTDDQGLITLFSKAAEAMFLHRPEQVLGQHFAVLLDPDSDSRKRLWRVLQEQQDYLVHGSSVELVGLRRDRSRFAIDARIAQFTVGEQTMYVSVVRDITERKMVEQELTQHRHHLEQLVSERTQELQAAREAADAANAAKSAFLASMSHEIRTPMNGVIGMLDVLSQTSLETDQMEMLGVVRDSAQALLGIINDVLDFSKIEAGKLEVVPEEFALDDQLEQVMTVMDHFARRKRVELSLSIDPAVPDRLRGDCLRLRQVLNNLLSNAVKFSSQLARTGKVSMEVSLVRTEGERCWLQFSVRDNGIGMRPEAFARLFHSFEQADASTTRRYGGTGLGLAIVKRLVELMDGQIAVESTPDVGSQFIVTLPLTIIEMAAETPLSGLGCVVVGADDPVTRRYLASIRRAGARPVAVPDLDEALKVQDATVWVVSNVHNELSEATLLAATKAAVRDGIRILVLEHGQRRLPRRSAQGVMLVDGNLITRRKLISLLARLGGVQVDAPLLISDQGGVTRARAPTRDEALTQGRLVLVAEDNEINQTVIRRQLGLLGCAADIANNGREALQMWQQMSYPLILTDLHMPDVDGYQFTTALRAEEVRLGRARTPVIALTANVMPEEDERCREVGMDGYATKPVPLPDLQRLLQRWLPALEPAPNTTSDAAPASGVHLDLEVLRALVGDDPDTIRELLSDFRQTTSATGDSLREFATTDRLAELGRAAHRFKSAARSVGALTLGNCCEALERAAKEDERDAAGPLLEALLRELGTVEDELDRALQAA